MLCPQRSERDAKRRQETRSALRIPERALILHNKPRPVGTRVRDTNLWIKSLSYDRGGGGFLGVIDTRSPDLPGIVSSTTISTVRSSSNA